MTVSENESASSLPLAVGLLAAGTVGHLFLERRQTKQLLESAGLPTVHWRPRFISYRPFEEDQKLASSTITRILPRMERLGGPFWMYGTVYGISNAVVHVAHPVPTKAIFGSSATSSMKDNGKRRSSIADTSGASKAPAYDHFKYFCGEGVFTADGEEWKAKRSSVMHCLIKGTNSSTSEISQRLELEANRAADDFTTQVRTLQDKQQNPVTTNVVPLLQRSTVGLIYRFTTHDEPDWGVNPRADDSKPTVDGDSEPTSLPSEDTTTRGPSGMLGSYLHSIIRIRMIILAQSRSIWFLLPRWFYRFFSSLHQDEIETVSPIREFASRACDRAKPDSPLGKLMEMESHRNTDGPESKTSKNALDEAITILFAGQDTSAATLSWTLHLLSIYKDIQSKLAEEVSTVVKEAGLDRNNLVITRKLFSAMPYLDAVIKESMRLYPVAPFVVRRIMEDLPISDGSEDGKKTVLPAGAVACIWIYGLHHNPQFWSRPDDFLPQRWIDPELKDAGQSNGSYMPFASGPRNCVGQPLAHIVLRTLLARLVLQFEFHDERLAEGIDPQSLTQDMQAGFTVLPSGGVNISIRERN